MKINIETATAFAILALPTHAAFAAPSASVIFSYKGGINGGFPEAGLLEVGRAFFTTTASGGFGHCYYEVYKQYGRCGTVVRLLPPSVGGGSWQNRVVYRFTPEPSGFGPLSGVTRDKNNVFYVVTQYGGPMGGGTLVQLLPQAGGPERTAKMIHTFDPARDGGFPTGRPYLDAAGAVYVVALQGGTLNHGALLRFTPPAGGGSGWTEADLYDFGSAADFQGATSGLRPDGNGGFFLTTGGPNTASGSVVDLSPPAQGTSPWQERVLYQFGSSIGQTGGAPSGNVVADASGNLYGAMSYGGPYNDGTVYELFPPAGGVGPYSLKVLYAFTGGVDGGHPFHPPVIDAKGDLFLSNYGIPGSNGGAVIELSPPAAGQTAWSETTLTTFTTQDQGYQPFAGLTVEDNGNFLLPTFSGGQYNAGAVIEITNTGFVVK